LDGDDDVSQQSLLYIHLPGKLTNILFKKKDPFPKKKGSSSKPLFLQGLVKVLHHKKTRKHVSEGPPRKFGRKKTLDRNLFAPLGGVVSKKSQSQTGRLAFMAYL